MTYSEAITILKAYNEWRRDNEGKHTMPDPKLIGEAIDVVVRLYDRTVKNGFITDKSMPDYDGEYLVAIEQNQECGNTWKFQKVIECFMCKWVVEDESEDIVGWMPLPAFPSKAV